MNSFLDKYEKTSWVDISSRIELSTRDDVENDECLIRFLSRFPHQEIVKWAKSIQDKKQTKYSERINAFLEYYDEDYVDILVRMFI